MLQLDEYIYMHDKIYEELTLHIYLNQSIFQESHGAYNGQIELANKIAKDVVENEDTNQFEYTDIELKNFKNISFCKLTIYVEDTYPCTEIDGTFDKKTKKFSSVTIYLDKHNRSSYKTLCIDIAHELLHLYQDSKLQNAGSSLLNKRDAVHYFDLLTRNDKVYDRSKSAEENRQAIENTAKQVLYSLLDFERDAYMSEINTIFSDLSDDELSKLKKDRKEATKYLAKTNIYKNYYAAKSILDILVNTPNDIFADIYCDVARNTWKSLANKTNKQILKSLNVKITKCINKLNKYFAQLYYEKFVKNDVHFIEQQNRYFDDTTLMLKEIQNRAL